MKDSHIRISASELTVMRALWDAGRPMTAAEIYGRVCAAAGWESTTVKTLVSRLTAKGALRQEKRDVYWYAPAVSRETYGLDEARSLIDSLYGGQAGGLVAALVDGGLSESDLAELRAVLEKGTKHE